MRTRVTGCAARADLIVSDYHLGFMLATRAAGTPI